MDRPTVFTGRLPHRSPSGGMEEPDGVYANLKSLLSIVRALIFDSRVDGGTPSRPAAPNGPATRPLLSLSTASMASFWWPASVPIEQRASCGVAWQRPESHRVSIESVSDSHTIHGRSMTFCS